ncbi:MAG: hypothetical protein LBC49_03515 [Bacteroidales bacterium]|jgi:hypothetical protein|nr:hypothetical protein [Bacteroidales bacterium]
MKKTIYISIIIILLAAGCRKDLPQLNRPEDYYISGNFTGTFEMFWSGMNHNYVFWEIDTTDWDRVYDEYYPKFKALDTLDADIVSKKDTAKRYYCKIASGLIDGHYTIIFDDNSAFVPSSARSRSHSTSRLWKDYQDQFLYICDKKLTNKESYITDDFVVITGCIPVNGGIVPYFFWSNFYLLQNSSADQTGRLRDIINNFFENVIRRPDVKGIILDVRGNGGGNAMEPGMLLGGLTDKDIVMAYTKRKNGEGRLDYTPWIPFRVITNDSNATSIKAPIVILTDMHSVSCSELMTMGIRNLPYGNGVQIGKTTHGGNGKLTYNSVENGGQFSTVIMFNGIEPRYQQIKLVYTSSEMTKAAFDGKCYEGKGIPPNIEVDLDIDQYLNSGIDTQLERALQYITTGN